jgi:low temperature requirement protein LtrA
MTARDVSESHRASSPLELLFDLTFVVAIALIAAQLAHSIEAGTALDTLGPYLMVFFAIWWAWMNFTWFASAYDTDDVTYRLLTLLQMGGVLVLAAGVPAAFDGQNYTAVTIGYLIMRVGLVSLWIRAAVQHPAGRTTAIRYAVGISVVQALWVSRLALPDEYLVVSFIIIAVLDLSVPPWAERTGSTAWHPHHIAERYGLFVIILLGESVLASTVGVQESLAAGLSLELVVIAASGLVLLFSLWWLYFSEPAGDGLASKRERSFLWGYGHYGVFAALAAIGAGLEVTVKSTVPIAEGAEQHSSISNQAVAFAVAIPVAIFLILLWALHAPIVNRVVIRPVAIIVAAVAIMLVPLAADDLGIAASLEAITGITVVLLAFALADESGRQRASARSLGA